MCSQCWVLGAQRFIRDFLASFDSRYEVGNLEKKSSFEHTCICYNFINESLGNMLCFVWVRDVVSFPE